jgi:hypothetical protein
VSEHYISYTKLLQELVKEKGSALDIDKIEKKFEKDITEKNFFESLTRNQKRLFLLNKKQHNENKDNF